MKCPELNPVENVWQFIRDNWLSNRVFRSYGDILQHCCFASTSHGRVCRSAGAIGRIVSNQRDVEPVRRDRASSCPNEPERLAASMVKT